MSRKHIVVVLTALAVAFVVVLGATSVFSEEPAPAGDPEWDLSAEEWEKKLTDEEFYVLREMGTERPYTGDLLENKKDGVYTCAACGQALFSSETKFESGTGWPSYYQPIDEKAVGSREDSTLGITRVEVHCSRCGGHLGHVFGDGPEPTGLRYCINSVSMDFEAKSAQ